MKQKGRGRLNETTLQKYPDLTLTELRLIPYIQYCLVNGGYMDIEKISHEERVLLHQWEKEGKIQIEDDNMGRFDKRMLSTNKEFWDYLTDVLFLEYCCEMEN